MDPLSISSAAIGLVQNVVQLINYVQDYRHSRADREQWLGDLEALKILLGLLHERAKEAHQSKSHPWFRGFLQAMEAKDRHFARGSQKSNDPQSFTPGGLWDRLEKRVQDLLSKLEVKTGFRGILQKAKHTMDKTDLDNAFKDINRLKSDLDSIMLQDQWALNQDIHKKVEALGDRANKDDMLEFLHWLSPLDFRERQDKVFSECFFNEASPPGQWLLGSEEFVAWKSGRCWPLYCYGNPGAGKVSTNGTSELLF